MLMLGIALLAPHLHLITKSHSHMIKATINNYHAIWFVAAAIFALLISFAMRNRGVVAQLVSLAVGLVLFFSAGVLQLADTALPYLDLRPLASALQPYKERPLAYTSAYAGELGYVAQLPRSLDLIEPQALDQWFVMHPDGIAIVRNFSKKGLAGAPIQSFPYRAKQSITIVEKPPKQTIPVTNQ